MSDLVLSFLNAQLCCYKPCCCAVRIKRIYLGAMSKWASMPVLFVLWDVFRTVLAFVLFICFCQEGLHFLFSEFVMTFNLVYYAKQVQLCMPLDRLPSTRVIIMTPLHAKKSHWQQLSAACSNSPTWYDDQFASWCIKWEQLLSAACSNSQAAEQITQAYCWMQSIRLLNLQTEVLGQLAWSASMVSAAVVSSMPQQASRRTDHLCISTNTVITVVLVIFGCSIAWFQHLL